MDHSTRQLTRDTEYYAYIALACMKAGLPLKETYLTALDKYVKHHISLAKRLESSRKDKEFLNSNGIASMGKNGLNESIEAFNQQLRKEQNEVYHLYRLSRNINVVSLNDQEAKVLDKAKGLVESLRFAREKTHTLEEPNPHVQNNSSFLFGCTQRAEKVLNEYKRMIRNQSDPSQDFQEHLKHLKTIAERSDYQQPTSEPRFDKKNKKGFLTRLRLPSPKQLKPFATSRESKNNGNRVM